PAKLRQNVTSPKGTTEAALKILMKKNGLEQLIYETVNAAIKRSKNLE
ncbi:MAG: pyrroline-5-carboxylate reductase, partial [Hellea sp.]|nr:pyrroline-5-carboxylate reductase [Hellea sp.]